MVSIKTKLIALGVLVLIFGVAGFYAYLAVVPHSITTTLTGPSTGTTTQGLMQQGGGTSVLSRP